MQHWGLILTDDSATPVLHDASNRAGPWAYRERHGDPAQSLTLIALIRVGPVSNHPLAIQIIQSLPANGSPSRRTGEAFTCRIWVKDVLVALHENAAITLPADIDVIERQAVSIGLELSLISEAGKGATVLNRPIGLM
ncbi:hypothetical protein ACHAPQ_009184 [Fusarium lateritium]